MSYREHPPPPALATWLRCTWERVADGPDTARVLPDGCIDIVWSERSGTALVGPNTTAFLSPVQSGLRIVGARMRPGGAPALLGVSAEALRDARPELRSVLGEDGRRLEEAMEGGTDPVAMLCAWLVERGERASGPDPVVTRTVAQLEVDRRPRVSDMASELGISERALRRRVTAAVGYGPKRLGRVLRLWRALGAARAGEDLAGAAFDAGYVDQAHFSQDCRELAGISPSALVG